MSINGVTAQAGSGSMPGKPIAAGRSRRLSADVIFRKAAVFAAFLATATLFATVIAIAADSWPAFHAFGIWRFLVSSEWNPVTQTFGAFPFIVGTLVSSAIAILLAVPVSFGIAVFIAEIAPAWIKKPVAGAVELLAAIPSIVYGLWGLLVFAPAFGNIEPWINDHLGTIPGIGALFQGPPMGFRLAQILENLDAREADIRFRQSLGVGQAGAQGKDIHGCRSGWRRDLVTEWQRFINKGLEYSGELAQDRHA